MLESSLNIGVPSQRIRLANDRPPGGTGQYVLYWMIANRRATWNYSLDRAIDWARQLGKPLVILEALRCDYRWASDRLHAFVIHGMADNERSFARQPVTYYPYLEGARGEGNGLLAALAREASVVVTDDFPCFFLPAMLRAAARQVPVQMELVDSNGLLPMQAADKVFARAFDFRRFLQKTLPDWLLEAPAVKPMKGTKLPRLDDLPIDITKRWPRADVAAMAKDTFRLASFPIDHHVLPSDILGGEAAARRQLTAFLDHKFAHYSEQRSEPGKDAASGLSPYLHFGHVSAHEIFAEVIDRENWTPDKLSAKANGSSKSWWGMSASGESFLDELVTWRELGYNMCSKQRNYDRYESLPNWAKKTLAQHVKDPRPHQYTSEEFEQASTHDPLWNAAQRQLVREGRIHNYLRMLWGKKILEWSPSPCEALDVMIELNNK